MANETHSAFRKAGYQADLKHSVTPMTQMEPGTSTKADGPTKESLRDEENLGSH
jgi:hypothetical protein